MSQAVIPGVRIWKSLGQIFFVLDLDMSQKIIIVCAVFVITQYSNELFSSSQVLRLTSQRPVMQLEMRLIRSDTHSDG